LFLLVAVGASAPTALGAPKKQKASPEHVAAIKKCNEDYAAAVKEAKMKKGKERKEALAAARTAKTDCIKGAPK
jgi:hypothetical protein